jgi:short-subunit dehydrogenase
MTKKNILITGASSGIGRACALVLGKDGHHIILTGRNEQRLIEVTKEVDNTEGSSQYFVADTRSSEEIDSIYNLAKNDLQNIDAIIINAGVGRFGNIVDLSEDDFDVQFDTNVKAVFLWIKKVIPDFRKSNKGQIIVMSSNLGFDSFGRTSLYAATKHAVQAIVKAARDELKGTFIKVASLNPGSVDTPWFDGKDVDRSKMLSPFDVAKAAKLLIDQEETSNIEHILLKPGKT